MSHVSAEDVRAFVLGRVSEQLSALGVVASEIPDDFDLLTEGVIDSLGLLEMIVAIEEHYGIETDFSDIDADDLTIVGPFCRYIAERGQVIASQAR